MNELELARNILNEVDREIAGLFEKRMEASKDIAEYKRKEGLPIYDPEREKAVIETNSRYIKNEDLRAYYSLFQQNVMNVSKLYQKKLRSVHETNSELITVNLIGENYDITICRGAMSRANELFDLDRKVLVVTDTGVPAQYAETLLRQCRDGYIYSVPEGENSKSLIEAERIIRFMLSHDFSRKDAVVAVGGGVVGDLAGFAASVYMRGIDFYNVPTTVLSQVDSSIGGKTAVDLGGYKNIIGSFYQPKGVIVDPDTLNTLSVRQTANGMAEALKTGVIGDPELFSLFENGNPERDIEEIIKKSLIFKKKIVEEDPDEKGIRKILNFGHTVGHAIEAVSSGELLHGESVALGMLFMSSEAVKERLMRIYDKLGMLQYIAPYLGTGKLSEEDIYEALRHDKKAADGYCSVIICDKPGSCRIEAVPIDRILKEGAML